MALRNQPYFPLYVQDFLTDEKLNLCSWQTQGIYIKVLCILHKQKEYGKLLFKQNSKQTLSTPLNFASVLIRLLPCQLDEMENALNELLENEVLQIEGDYLVQKRMVKDGATSEARSQAGKKGGGNPNLFKQNPKLEFKQKDKQNPEYENETINIIIDRIKVLCNGNYENVFSAFEKWRDYLTKQYNITMLENQYTYQNLEQHVKNFGVDGFIDAVNNSILKNYKTLWKPKENSEGLELYQQLKKKNEL